MSTLSASFRKISSKLNDLCHDKVKQRFFQQSRGRNSKINDPIRPLFKIVRDFIYVHLSCKFQVVLIKAEGVMVMTKSIRSFFQQSRKYNSKINDPIWPDFKLVQEFTHTHIICKFTEDLIKTESYADDKVKQKFFSAIKGM